MTVSRPTAPFPTRYRLDGDDRVFLAFRTDTCDGRVLLLLVEDSEDQHPFDVVSIHLDDARLHAATEETKDSRSGGDAQSPQTSGGVS